MEKMKMNPVLININGKLINLNQVAYCILGKHWLNKRIGIAFFFSAQDSENGEMILFIDETPAVRKAWEYLSDKVTIATFVDEPENGETK